ncbi:hypothetical protein XENTR_v10005099 [Xenopus tropicalis]|nr:hypothetical protein XENTR_v10005099 [Xenopus tropicalis]
MPYKVCDWLFWCLCASETCLQARNGKMSTYFEATGSNIKAGGKQHVAHEPLVGDHCSKALSMMYKLQLRKGELSPKAWAVRHVVEMTLSLLQVAVPTNKTVHPWSDLVIQDHPVGPCNIRGVLNN